MPEQTEPQETVDPNPAELNESADLPECPNPGPETVEVDAKTARSSKQKAIRLLEVQRADLVNQLGETVSTPGFTDDDDNSIDLVHGMRENILRIDAKLADLRAKTPAGWKRGTLLLTRTYTAFDGDLMTATIEQNEDNWSMCLMRNSGGYTVATMTLEREGQAVQFANAIGREFRRQHAKPKPKAEQAAKE